MHLRLAGLKSLLPSLTKDVYHRVWTKILRLTRISRTAILVFFVTNYLAHAATIVGYPGESLVDNVLGFVFAILFPASGIIRGLSAIFRHAELERTPDALRGTHKSTPLEVAARAGALCHVIRSEAWLPRNGDSVRAVWTNTLVQPPRPNSPGFISFLREMARRFSPLPDGLASVDTRASQKERDVHLWRRDGGKQSIPNMGMNLEVGRILPGEPECCLAAHDTQMGVIKIFRPVWMFCLYKTWFYYDSTADKVGQSRGVHGFYHLTDEYALAHVPHDAQVEAVLEGKTVTRPATLASSYSSAKAFVAIIQLCFAVASLVQTSEKEIHYYGVASYHLTVIPYAIMSLINLIGNLVNPAYAAMYLVHTDIMEEARGRGCEFDGIVGQLVPQEPQVDGVSGLPITVSHGTFHEASSNETYVGQKVLPDTSGPAVWKFMRSKEDVIGFGNGRVATSHGIDSTTSEARQNLYSSNYDSPPEMTSREHSQSKISRSAMPTAEPETDFTLYATPCDWNTFGAAGDRQHARPSLFVPACSGFRRRGHPRYRIDTARFGRSRSGYFHFHSDERWFFGRPFIVVAASWLVNLVAFAVIAALSGLRRRNSTRAQCVYVMLWLAMGVVAGSGVADVLFVSKRRMGAVGYMIAAASFLFIYAVPSLLGFWQVAAQMVQYTQLCRNDGV